MKVIFYYHQKKITVENILLSNIENLEGLLEKDEITEISMPDLLSYNLQVSSTHGEIDMEYQECCGEIQEGTKDICWQQETIN